MGRLVVVWDRASMPIPQQALLTSAMVAALLAGTAAPSSGTAANDLQVRFTTTWFLQECPVDDGSTTSESPLSSAALNHC